MDGWNSPGPHTDIWWLICAKKQQQKTLNVNNSSSDLFITISEILQITIIITITTLTHISIH